MAIGLHRFAQRSAALLLLSLAVMCLVQPAQAQQWTMTKTANPTTYFAAGQIINYTYVLTATIVAPDFIDGIVVTDNRVAQVNCPGTVLNPGGTMTCTGSYTINTDDMGAASVTNTATANGNYNFQNNNSPPRDIAPIQITAQATVNRVAPPTGSIVIIKNSVGLDGRFDFTSSLGAAPSFVLTTNGGAATRSFGNLAPGTYRFTEVNLPARWSLTSLVCTGDVGGTPTVVNVAARSVSIGLNGGESIVCTFTNTYDVDKHILTTQAAIRHFMASRMNFLASHEPDRARLSRRLPGSLWGDDPSPRGSMASAGAPFAISGGSQEMSSQISFATSSSQIASARAEAEAREKAAREKAGALSDRAQAGPVRPRPIEVQTIDIWTEAHYSNTSNGQGLLRSQGQFAVGYLGADVLISQSMLAGVLVQADWGRERNAAVNSTVEGSGLMAGPYTSMRLSPHLFFDVRAAWGSSNNQVTPFGTYRDRFSTERMLISSKLTGNWNMGNVRFTPSAGVIIMQDAHGAYTDRLGFRIPGQTVNLGRATFGPEVAYRFIGGNGVTYEPLVSLTGNWNFVRPGQWSGTGFAAPVVPFHAMVQAGMLIYSERGITARVVATYDGLGSANYRALGAQALLSVPLH